MIRTIKLLVFLFVLQWCCSCNKNFLDLQPLDALSTVGGLASPNELRMYLNQFYQGTFPSQPTGIGGTGIAFDDASSDNMIFSAVNNRLNGVLAISNATAITEYKSIRGINYFLEHAGNAKGDTTLINRYRGEALFFRAYFYFGMVKKYGNVTWVNKVLPEDQELMQQPRDERTLIIDSVLSDLDKAVQLLPVQSNSASMRLHRDVALAFISRVALYEATWQKYHRAKNDAFYSPGISDAKITGYFTQAKVAAQQVVSGGKWSIYNTGRPLQDYADLFITTDLSANPEVLFWRKYNYNDNIGHSVSKYISTDGGDLGVTLSLVDDYLGIDGAPFTGAARQQAQEVYSNELLSSRRDPRLSQTVGIPGQPLKLGGVLVPAYPPLNQTGFNRSTTGFPLHKYLEYNNLPAVTDDNQSTAPAIIFRYAEVLLNYAEAVAELGGSAGEISAILQPLRSRAGMPALDADREYNTDAAYPFRTLSKTLQAVRRERRVELACEGFRMDDIFRWAAADELLTGKRPLGALFAGSDLDQQNKPGGFYSSALLYYDTAPAGKSINFYLSGSAGDALRYIDPYKNVLPSGYGFKSNRDYLLPVQDRMLQLTNGQWKQNPGW
ncbi:putative outer membrane starch-binding protein [Chitinophaga polysaccharea]|uniref:Putative outer membrane starch-binding protein n=1 Tax=Chitinophaga polysaccharea TaxID=1293035 RepID=A0A561PGT4_9BACT|nr:RagB/SusD family nutrient uptake outer membrane protein [Chitinophaga polysaccharea]TWF37337.1 putative outer membrane starch-binding protein [Chitinophaga polysaccharea]